MNRQIEIKGFQMLFLNLLMYIIWCDVVNIIFILKVNHLLFIISFIASISLMIIYEILKKNHKYGIIALIIPSIASFIVLFNKYTLNMALFSMIYVLLVLILIYNTKDTIMEYSSVKNIGQLALGIAIITIVVSIFYLKHKLFEELIKYILMLLISNIILLRETRCYSHNLIDKKMRNMNVGIVIFFFLIISEKVENLFKQVIVKIISTILLFLVELAIKFVSLTMGFWAFLGSKFNIEKAKETFEKMQSKTRFSDTLKKEFPEYKYDYEAIKEPPETVVQIIKIIILVIIIVIVYKQIKKYIVSGKSNNQYEIREKIKIVKPKKKSKVLKSIKNYLNGKGSVREQIYYIFGNFQNKAYKNQLYKDGMTARELNHSTKNHIKDKECEIDDITKVYNEAKFSNHTMNQEDLERIVKGYEEIKGEL
ncbi:hypothetical protein [Oceanirhabdus sp. W0125-5]|uniref:hypothetical protein n=1 Tax=Oceanirhabdus sp. W0125-5 TaxID=2999116 RepID=UPI0022F2AB70|nr:hypothetical protein [Oceanirhabdus sp. W0125-5]WBW97186.1 hypothetical protein OW730_26385 [Oceanirhabdus sp. W0125-5]